MASAQGSLSVLKIAASCLGDKNLDTLSGAAVKKSSLLECGTSSILVTLLQGFPYKVLITDFEFFMAHPVEAFL